MNLASVNEKMKSKKKVSGWLGGDFLGQFSLLPMDLVPPPLDWLHLTVCRLPNNTGCFVLRQTYPREVDWTGGVSEGSD